MISLQFNLPWGMLLRLLYLKMILDEQPINLQYRKFLSLEKYGLNDLTSLNYQILCLAALHITEQEKAYNPP